MPGLFVQSFRLLRALAEIQTEPRGRALVFLVSVQLLAGTVFYAGVEGWRWLDALYFSVIALTTVEFGDLTPVTDAGKIFTILYLFTGIGLLLSLLTLVAETTRRRPHGDPAGPRDPAGDVHE